MNDDDKVVSSRLSRKITRDGVTIGVLIYRGMDETEWRLEVVNQDSASIVWEDNFATEQDALNEVFQTIAREGITCFSQDPEQKPH